MKRATPLVLLLFTLSGVSGLVYEIVWIRLFSHLLGGTSYAISIVLAAFMGGLALGSRHYGPVADRHERPLRLYAKLELGIALCGALVYLLLRGAPPAYAAVAGHLPPAALGLLRVLIAGVLLLPPTFLMGGTLPVLSRVVVTRRERLGRGLGLLYAVNTFGAVLGSFLAGFVLIAALGILGSTVLAIAINLLIAAAILAVDGRVSPLAASSDFAEGLVEDAQPAAAPTPTRDAERQPELGARMLAWIFALSGFASLGYELYWTRGLQHFLGNSTYAFSAMLTTFLLGLAAGGWVGGRLADRVKSPARLLGWVQLGVGVTALATLLLLWEWLPRVDGTAWLNGRALSWPVYLVRRFLMAFLVMAVPTFLTGMTFPLVNRIGIRSLSRLGRGVGSFYFANTLGAIAGSLAAGFLVLPLLGVKGAILATGLFSAALGVAIHLARRDRGGLDLWIAGAAFVALVVAAPALRQSGLELLADSQEPGDTVLFDAEDHAAETRVYRKRGGVLQMAVDGHHIGGTDTPLLRKEKILAHLPMMLRPAAKHTLSVGLGSGITLGTLALYPQIERLDCVEIVPGVVAGARFFDEANDGVLSDPRVDLHVGDGVQYLLTTQRRFDVISSDSKLNPEYSGNAPLLSVDYYRLCRDRLTDDGVMVQWLACHLPLTDLEVIARSFSTVFPHVAIYWFDPYNVILAGSKSPLVLDLDAIRASLADPARAADLAGMALDDPYLVAGLWICAGDDLRATLAADPAALLNTWQRPRLEFTLGRDFRSKSTAYHEDDVLRWLQRLRTGASAPQALAGEVDPERYDAFRASADALLKGYAQGGGIDQLDNGRDIFAAALAANPDDARLAELMQQLDLQEEGLERAYAAGQIDSPETLTRLGLQRRSQGRADEALALFEQALKARPKDPDILYNRLLTLKDLKRQDDFDRALAEFLELYPRDSRGPSLQGRALADAGDMPAALAAFQRAVDLSPDSPTTLNNLATALARMDRYAEAGDAFERVCALQPSYQQAAFFAAASYSMAGLTDKAAHWARVCIDQGLAEPARFREDPLFVQLRDSAHWDAATGEPRP